MKWNFSRSYQTILKIELMMCIESKGFFFIKKLRIFSTTMPAAEQKKRQLFRVNYLHCTCCCSLWLWLLSFSKKFSKFPNEAVHKCSLSDDTHYDVHENCLIFKTPRTPCPSTSKILPRSCPVPNKPPLSKW